MKYIFVTGGVMSGLGKGITAASIARLLLCHGLSTTIVKLDPYLQVDAGTMSPSEHGEVFVTDDGGETDLDIGHYERFLDTSVSRHHSITTGSIYQRIIMRERRGDYLGQTVQVIPHVIHEIIDQLDAIATTVDVCIVEIGGTIGDIEGPHFIETCRQLRSKRGTHNVMSVHVVPLIKLTTSREYKTKPLQHSVIALRSMGIQPDMIVCRSDREITKTLRDKISLFADVPSQMIISAHDAASIYHVPLIFGRQQVDQHIINQLDITTLLPSPGTENIRGDMYQKNITDRHDRVMRITDDSLPTVRVAIAGKYTNATDAYLSVQEALIHAGMDRNCHIDITRVDTETYQHRDRESERHTFVQDKNISAVIVPGGFGERGVEGMINIAGRCRTHDIPYLGICLGMQVATIAYARNQRGHTDAHSTEFRTDTSFPVVTLLDNQNQVTDKGGTMRLGAQHAIVHGAVADLYREYGPHLIVSPHDNDDSITVTERHRHRYEIHPDVAAKLMDQDISPGKKVLTVGGRHPDHDVVEFVMGVSHPFFIATQAHPELQSRVMKAHPLFVGLLTVTLQT